MYGYIKVQDQIRYRIVCLYFFNLFACAAFCDMILGFILVARLGHYC